MSVTIRDVAERLHLSITTVSRALDGYDDVAEDTRQRVIQTAREMGYAPSRAARQLRRQKADAIGYILPARTPRFADPASLDLIAGLADTSTSQNYDLLISTAPPDEEAEQELYRRWVQGRRVDGIVLSRIRLDDWRVVYLSEAGFPFVASGHSLSDIVFPFIEVDGRTGMKVLVRHLVELGHRRIAFIGAPENLVLSQDRLKGYQEGLAEAGLPLQREYLAAGDLTRSGGFAAAQRLLDLPEPPTAIMGVSDLTAIGAIRAALQRGLVVGRDLAITGYDGIADAETTEPGLTTLNHPVYSIAQRLVKMLLALIEDQPLPEQQVLLQPELVVRASTVG